MGFFDLFKKNKISNIEEVSPCGSRIYTHVEPQVKGYRPAHATKYMEEIERHCNKVFPDRKTTVFHEIVSEFLHIDVCIMEPNQKEDFYILYTMGMSAMPMTLPDEFYPQFKHLEKAELIMFLPKDWRVCEIGNDATPEEIYWPVRMLKTLARFPHEYSTWFGQGHTIPNGEEYSPYADNTKLCCIMLVGLPEKFSLMKAHDGSVINFYNLVPLYKEETDYKLENSSEAIFEKIAQIAANPFLLNINRKNVCATQ